MRTVHKGGFSENVTVVPDIRGLRDVTTGDSDKSFIVPAGQRWKINFGFVAYTSSADVGNRQLVFEVYNEFSELVGRVSAGVVQAAGVTRYYLLMAGTFRETAFINNEIQIPIPSDTFIGPGYTIRIRDGAAIAAAADNMLVHVGLEVQVGVEYARV